MKFLFLDPDRHEGDLLRLDAADVTHLCRVLRLETGALCSFVCTDGSVRWAARLGEVDRRRAWAQILETQVLPSPPRPRLVLAAALLKGDAQERALRMAVEVGADVLRPLACRRSVRRLEGRHGEKVLERWRRLIREACQQSGRERLPELHAPATIAECLAALPAESHRLSFTVEDPEARRLAELSWEGKADRVVFVGPEGDFDPDEREALSRGGAESLRLDGAVLRAETAAPVCLALVGHHLGRI